MSEKMRLALAKVRALGLDRTLALLLVTLSFLLIIQGLRLVVTALSWRGLAARVHEGALAPERTDRKAATEYDAILDKGLLGKAEKGGGPSAPAPPVNVYGILGDKALLGASSNDAKPLGVGAEVPGGEKLVEIGTAEVVLEKDGNRRTLKVFPALSGPKTSAAPGAAAPVAATPGATPPSAPPGAAPPSAPAPAPAPTDAASADTTPRPTPAEAAPVVPPAVVVAQPAAPES